MSYRCVGVSRHPFPRLRDEWCIVFNRVFPRMYSALFGANLSFELNQAFRKLARLLVLRRGRFRGVQSCRVGPWPFCDAHVFPGWGSDLSAACMSFRVGLCLLGNRVPKRGNLAEICGCERLLGFIFAEPTDSGDITPGQIFRFRSCSQNHRSQPKISAIFLGKATKYKACFRIRAAVPPCRRAAVPPCRRAWRSSVRFATAWQHIARMRLNLA